MKKRVVCLAVFCLISLTSYAYAQTTQTKTKTTPTAPTEVGTTTMPAGQYLVIDQNTGNRYSLMVTTKGNMILGPAPNVAASAVAVPGASAAAAASSSNVRGLAEKEVQRFMQKQGINQIQNLVK